MPADSINNSQLNVIGTNINSTGETLKSDMELRINTGGDTIGGATLSSRMIQSPKD
jgi:hypothetical protein